ncbi:MAG: type IX secretion system membrane protein PorP/SprF [Bacteroidota bacterium]
MKTFLSRILILNLIFCFISLSKVLGQDVMFTQFYASPLYLNPAFSGIVDDYRIATTYRRQWAAIPRGLETNIASFDYNLKKINSGIGVYLMNDRSGGVELQSNHIGFSYAYQLKLSKDWQLRMGLQGGFIQRSLGFSSLVFGDQIDNNLDNSAEDLGDFNAGFADFGTGLMIYNEVFWGGVSLFHLNEPSRQTEAGNMTIPRRISLQGGAKIPVNRYGYPRMFISPAFLYQNQGPFDQLDLGVNFFYEPLVVGLWYRGLPLKQNAADNISQDAIAALVGVQIRSLWVGYSYDINVSGLAGQSGGSHEISVIFEPFKISSKSRIQCPAFYSN